LFGMTALPLAPLAAPSRSAAELPEAAPAHPRSRSTAASRSTSHWKFGVQAFELAWGTAVDAAKILAVGALPAYAAKRCTTSTTVRDLVVGRCILPRRSTILRPSGANKRRKVGPLTGTFASARTATRGNANALGSVEYVLLEGLEFPVSYRDLIGR
jgi:hypothetical protein